ncbi:hypothetical protein XENTR_v10014030 [Xenopus tropicalis]|uniref:Synaptotagmin-like protein 2 isoform X1 n=1 Tax=Xenopus tropicalis TaxID=8364 RepID=A0A8J0QKG6_XENTR|nr:synaptotagmin-like protein 2 isoform X1 [Xenopus tropicalis]KAE8602557.1 hypothetical protein XENTR_v10014030 [Xenopus tropicalis]
METLRAIDLSFLTAEEEAVIKDVLNRDASLRKCEEKRIRKMKKSIRDPGCLKLKTGEWFEDLKSKRYIEYSSATDLLKYAFQKERKPGLFISLQKSWLSKAKVKNCTALERMFKEITPPPKSVTSRDNERKASGSFTVEEMSITQVLKDLELILELEIAKAENQTPTEEAAFSIKTVESPLVENTDHSGQSDILTSVSPTETKHHKPERHFFHDKNVCLKEESIIHGKSFTVGSQAVSSTELQFFEDFLKHTKGNNSPFCSSPCLPEENIFQETDAKNEKCISLDSQTIKEPLSTSENVGIGCNNLSSNSDSDECSLEDNESTIEQSTLLAVTLSILPEDVGILQTPTDWKLQHQQQHCKKANSSLPQVEEPAERMVKENLATSKNSSNHNLYIKSQQQQNVHYSPSIAANVGSLDYGSNLEQPQGSK